MGIASIALGSYYLVRDHVVKLMSSYITGSSAAQARGLLDDGTYNFVFSLCVILIATGVAITAISMIGFCGAVQRNPHCILGVCFRTSFMVFYITLVINYIHTYTDLCIGVSIDLCKTYVCTYA